MLLLNTTAAVTEAAAAATEAAPEFAVSISNFVDSLPYMGTGMLGIFIVMGSIILSTFILNKVCNRKPKGE